MNRSRFLSFFAVGIICILATNLSAQNLTHCPVVGAVTETSAAFVFRVDAAADLQMELSVSPDFTNSIFSTTTSTVSDSDFFAQMSVDGLVVNTLYYYRPVINGIPVNDGIARSFRTFPPAGTGSSFSFLTGSGQQCGGDEQSCIGDIFYVMAQESSALFFLQQGDWGYPDTTGVNYFSLDYVNVQASYRERYRTTYPAIELLRTMAVAYTYDDHDMIADNADGFNFPAEGIRNSIRGIRNMFPNYNLPNPDYGIWHAFQCGDAEIFAIDNRSQRRLRRPGGYA